MFAKTMEIFVYEAGFIPGIENQLAQHRRVRYRLVAASNNAPVEPALEIVHYTQAFPEHRVNVRSVPLTPQVQKRLQDRHFLEAQGGLPRKEFMLHDSSNWPTISTPPSGTPGNPYQQGPGNFKGAQQGAPRPIGAFPVPPPSLRSAGGMGPSPAKRQRQSGPGRMPSGTTVPAYATSTGFVAATSIDEASTLR